MPATVDTGVPFGGGSETSSSSFVALSVVKAIDVEGIFEATIGEEVSECSLLLGTASIDVE